MPNLGTTFSHIHSKSIGLDPHESLKTILDLNLKVIRLGCYWNEIQPKKKEFNFSGIQNLLELTEKRNQNVVLTVGMKAPRWPEYFIPKWLASHEKEEVYKYAEEFINKTVETLKAYSCIKYWQVENEPLDPSGPHHDFIPFDVLQKEVTVVRNLDPTRKILLTVWGNELIKRKNCDQCIELGDIIGLDLYYKVPKAKILSKTFYRGPDDSQSQLKRYIAEATTPIWITELQAEPWEYQSVFTTATNTPSFNPTILKQNIQNALELDVETILLWGAEYWLWKAKKGERELLDLITIIQEKKITD